MLKIAATNPSWDVVEKNWIDGNWGPLAIFDDITGCVTDLRLDGLNLTGALPPEIGQLTEALLLVELSPFSQILIFSFRKPHCEF